MKKQLTNKQKEGRPTKYNKDFLPDVTGLCMLGKTDEEIAEYLGVCTATFYNWARDYPEFLEAIREGKEKADFKVANSLYDKALAGDTTAMIFWLKNRQKKTWRDKHDHDHNHKGSVTLNIDKGDAECL